MSSEQGEVQEVVIDHVSRFLSKLFSIFGLILSTIMFFLYFAFGYCIPFRSGDLWETFFIGTVVAVCSALTLYSLSANKPYLETSDDGLMVGGFVRGYCPW